MVPLPSTLRYPHSSRLLYLLASLASQNAPRLLRRLSGSSESELLQDDVLVRREKFDPHDGGKSIAFAVLIPVLVLMSGLFAGLTLGYMSLDETQLNVLSISGTPDQKKYANKIKPIRKNGHLLLVTLLLSNMIVNETLPIIADPVLGGGVPSVVVSTVLIVIFAEIIPQSLFTRHGLYLGAKMAGFTRFLIYFMGFIAWPVAKLLEFVLGAHHGIIYRRAELKELIAMHDAQATLGGDLKTDTVAIIGATLDLQEKVVRQAMTPIDDVFMLSVDSKLDYGLLKKICQTGHSRVPVYEEIEVPIPVVTNVDKSPIPDKTRGTMKVKKIIGILLVKHCVLLDPKDATPLRSLPLNKVPFVPYNEPLLGILDKFQEGRSHMAIVSRFSVDKAASVKKAVKRGLTQRLRERVGMGDSSDSDSEDDSKGVLFSRKNKKRTKKPDLEEGTEDGSTIKDEGMSEGQYDNENEKDGQEMNENEKGGKGSDKVKSGGKDDTKKKITAFQLPKGMTSMSMLEQSMPADAVLTKAGAAQFLQGFDPAVMPLGIITLEDVLEELIGEEIYDEFDSEGALGEPHAYEKPGSDNASLSKLYEATAHNDPENSKTLSTSSALKGLGFFRTRSAPPVPRDHDHEQQTFVHDQPTTNSTTSPNNDNNVVISVVPGMPLPMPVTIQMPKPIKTIGRGPPSIILERNSSSESDGSYHSKEETTIIAPAPVHASTSAPFAPSTSTSGHLPIPSSSRAPSPAIEAILLGGKRSRQIAASTSAASNSGGGSPTMGSIVPGAASILGSGGAGVAHQTGVISPAVVPLPSPSASGAGLGLAPGASAGAHAGGGRAHKFKSSPLPVAGGTGGEGGVNEKEKAT